MLSDFYIGKYEITQKEWKDVRMHGNDAVTSIRKTIIKRVPPAIPRGRVQVLTVFCAAGAGTIFSAYCRVVYRDYFSPGDSFDFIGFRLVLVP